MCLSLFLSYCFSGTNSPSESNRNTISTVKKNKIYRFLASVSDLLSKKINFCCLFIGTEETVSLIMLTPMFDLSGYL